MLTCVMLILTDLACSKLRDGIFCLLEQPLYFLHIHLVKVGGRILYCAWIISWGQA
jgi:hypothetical protein